MKKMNKKFLWCFASSFLIYAKGISADSGNQSMIFKSNAGSIVEISVSENNKITGYFTSKVSIASCPEALDQKRPITGYIVDKVLSFSVAYPSCKAVLSMTGELCEQKKLLTSYALLNIDSPNKFGNHIIGHDLFKKES